MRVSIKCDFCPARAVVLDYVDGFEHALCAEHKPKPIDLLPCNGWAVFNQAVADAQAEAAKLFLGACKR